MRIGRAIALLLATSVAIASASCGSAASPPETLSVPLRPGTSEPAILSLHRLDPGKRVFQPHEEAPLLVAVWQDGTICWSRDPLHGGAPYRSARLDRARLDERVERLRRKLEPPPTRGRLYCVPDGSSLDLALLVDGRMLGLSSCIPCFEDDPRLVATDSGIEPLDGRDRASVIASQNPALREFRKTWDECVSMVHSLVPAEGAPLEVDHFEYVWR